MQKLKAIAGWTWFAFCAVGAIAAANSPGIVAAIALLTCGAMSLPPIWKLIRQRGLRVPVWSRAAVGTLLFYVFASQLPDNVARKDVQSRSAAVVLEGNQTKSLVEIEAKILPGAIAPMSKEAYPTMFAKLGRPASERANKLARWAAVAVAQNEECTALKNLDVTDDSTSDDIRWFGYCSDTAKFIVTEQQAEATQIEFDPKASPAAKAEAAKAAKPELLTAQWRNFDEAAAVRLCDQLVIASAVNRGSVDLAWGRNIRRDADIGIAIIERDFDAENAMGGTISSRYRCEVRAETGQVSKLLIRELTGWRRLQ